MNIHGVARMHSLFYKDTKKGDINLVQGKRDFDVLAEIKSLHFVVRPISTHICRNCLNFLKHRANQRTKKDRFAEKKTSTKKDRFAQKKLS
jgi:uncharacterized protein YlaI